MNAVDGGGVTAEFAVALPAIAIVLAAAIGGVQLAAAQVRLQDAAGLAARSAARGEDPAAGVAPGIRLSTWTEGGLVCASAGAAAAWAPGLPPVELAAGSCALAGGR